MSSQHQDAEIERTANAGTAADAQPSARIASHRHADFSRAVLEDLYRYPRKQVWITWVLWAITGLLGGHRFYLDRTGTGALMLFTGGGGALWWIVDAFLIRKMVDAYNADQAQRQATGLPPKALSFMPPARGGTLPAAPEWVAKRGGRKRIIGDVIVLTVAGMSVGAFAKSSGNYEAVITILVLCAITLAGARWDALATIPILRGLDRWSHRLRLYYYTNDPGGPLALFFRPVVGLLSAPFRLRARAEAWLYLQVGAWFTIVFTGVDLVQATGIATGDLGIHLGGFFADMVLTFASIYAFAAPIGAILTTHVLLEKSDFVVWMLTGVALAAMAAGIVAAT
jgi:TM2 domain-containing membrane protein YozV